MSKEMYVPLPEVDSDRVKVNLVLPFGMEEKLGLNVRKIEALCQIAGIRLLQIQNDPNPERSKAIPMVVGVNNRDTALMGGAKISQVPTFKGDWQVSFNDKSVNINSGWINLKIDVNTEEIKSEMMGSNRVVVNPEEWSKEINGALTKGIVNFGVKFLITPQGLGDKISELIESAVISSYFLSASFSEGEFVTTKALVFGLKFLIYELFLNGMGIVLNGREDAGKGRRISIMPFELDRAGILYLASLGKPLVKEL